MVGRSILLLGLALLLCGCRSASSLTSEDTIPALAALKDRAAEFPHCQTLVPTGGPDEPTVRLAVTEYGPGTRERAVVLLHGVFSDMSTWRFIVGGLCATNDVYIVEMPGCGASDAPDPRGAEDVYTPEGVARRTLEAVQERFSRRESPPSAVTIVGHSYGGMLAIRMFADPEIRSGHAGVLDLVDRLVLLSPADVSVHRPDSLFLELAQASNLRLNLGITLGLIEGRVTDGTIESTPASVVPLREEAEKRLEILKSERRRRGMQALLRNAITWKQGPTLRPDWDAMESLEEGYARVDVPCLILWGRRDETLPISMGYKLAAQLPDATLLPVPEGMHSIHLEQPELCVRLIDEFGADGKAPSLRAGP